MKKILVLAIAVPFVLYGMVFTLSIANATKPTEPQECPAGTFWRGGCVSVTGCPYGDSIPLGPECDKHKPVVESTPPTPVVEDEVEVFEGK